jgi:hypothetical protein
MTQDHPEPPEEIGQALGRLGRVAPPDPAVLDAAREVLWAAVAAEMLPGAVAGGAGQMSETGRSRRGARRETDRRETDRRETDRRETDRRETDRPGP